LQEDEKVKHLLVISQEKYARDVGNIKLIPWKLFLKMLWAGEFDI